MVNKVILIGNVGNDPEIIEKGDVKIAKFSIATSESYKNKQGEKVSNTEWHNIVAFGKLAEIIQKYVKKGSKLYVEGKISYSSYEKDGVKMHSTQIKCNNISMLGTKIAEKTANENKEQFDDDMPF